MNRKGRRKAKTKRARTKVPNWIVLAAILLTAGATVLAMSQTLRGQGWTADPSTPFLPRDTTRVMVPTVGAFENAGLRVAAVRAPGVIAAGSVARHADYGTCTGCHTILTVQGALVPAISALATMPHQYRGVCANCHIVTAVSLPSRVAPGAATPLGPLPFAQPGAGAPPPSPQPAGGPQGAAPTPF